MELSGTKPLRELILTYQSVGRHLPGNNFTRIAHELNLKYEFGHYVNIVTTFRRDLSNNAGEIHELNYRCVTVMHK